MGKTLKVLVLVTASLVGTCATAGEDNVVWVWNSQCAAPTHVALQVSLDGNELYSTKLILCRWERRYEDGRASFQFTPKRTLIWYGYRSDEGDDGKGPGDPTPAGTKLTVEFWQAGGEADMIELGYSVAAGNELHMNSIHILSPTRPSSTTMAPGLVLKTLPEGKP